MGFGNNRGRRVVAAFAAMFGLADTVAGTPAILPVVPLPPEESLAKIHVPRGFCVELVAAEPLVLDPVAFDWDERGRLWVVEMADYPVEFDGNGKPGGRVRILEDTDRDGRFDRSQVFADGLSFPTGILTWRDGCLVTAAPEILFLRDTDGDGRVDERQVLFTGFNTGNQQLRVNGLRWGLDGWVYCANGGHHVGYGKDVSVTSLLTGEKIALGTRDFRFDPDTGAFDPLSGPAQFGRSRDSWGRWFGVQNSYPLWHYAIEDRYLRRNPYVAPPNPKVLLTGSNPRVFSARVPEKRFHSFGVGREFHPGLGRDPKRAFAADKQSREIVPGKSGHPRAMRTAQCEDLAIREHDFQTQYMVDGHAVLERVRAAGVLRDIPANRTGSLAGGIGREM